MPIEFLLPHDATEAIRHEHHVDPPGRHDDLHQVPALELPGDGTDLNPFLSKPIHKLLRT
jgi:hypothetical protein